MVAVDAQKMAKDGSSIIEEFAVTVPDGCGPGMMMLVEVPP